MLVGKKNQINEKLVKEISQVYKIKFKDLKSVLEESDNGYSPRIILVNLMDVGPDEEKLLQVLKRQYPNTAKIAIHCFQTQSLIKSTLEKGFDKYISIFNISEDFFKTIKS